MFSAVHSTALNRQLRQYAMHAPHPALGNVMAAQRSILACTQPARSHALSASGGQRYAGDQCVFVSCRITCETGTPKFICENSSLIEKFSILEQYIEQVINFFFVFLFVEMREVLGVVIV